MSSCETRDLFKLVFVNSFYGLRTEIMSRYSGTDSTTDTGRHCFTNWGHWVTISRGRRRRGARQVMVWIQHTVVSVSGLGENETGSTQFIGFT